MSSSEIRSLGAAGRLECKGETARGSAAAIALSLNAPLISSLRRSYLQATAHFHQTSLAHAVCL